MNESNHSKELKLSIYKILKELVKWYRDELPKPQTITASYVRDLKPIWMQHETYLNIAMDTDDCTYAMVTFDYNSKFNELLYTDLKFIVSKRVVSEEEVLEHLLVGVVRLYTKFKEQVECTEKSN